MIYWLQEATTVGGQGGGPSWLLSAGIIGAIVSLIGLIFAQLRHTQTLRQTRELEDRRRLEARDLEVQRASETALQKYFEEMGQLLRQGLRRSYWKEIGHRELLAQPFKFHEEDEGRIYEEQQLANLASAQTRRLLQQLVPQRKEPVLRFLYSSMLLDREARIINLSGADLNEAILCEYISEYNTDEQFEAREYLRNTADPSKYLSKDDLSAVLESTDEDLDNFVDLLDSPTIRVTNLPEVDLSGVHLMKAYLRHTKLRSANLGGAYLMEADLIMADLSNAFLGKAFLDDAVLLAANLNGANLNRVSAYDAVLVKANLANADLSQANLTEANLRRANLCGTNLRGAKLQGAFLQRTEDLSQEQIDQTFGDETTELPDHLQRPAHWSKGESKES